MLHIYKCIKLIWDEVKTIPIWFKHSFTEITRLWQFETCFKQLIKTNDLQSFEASPRTCNAPIAVKWHKSAWSKYIYIYLNRFLDSYSSFTLFFSPLQSITLSLQGFICCQAVKRLFGTLNLQVRLFIACLQPLFYSSGHISQKTAG